jgi:hypothetical protein
MRVASEGARQNGLFYRVILPLLILANLGLGLFILSRLTPLEWQGWLELLTGAFCCAVAGWLMAASWSRSYWGAAMKSQLTRWRRQVDIIFGWLEETPVSVEAMNRLKTRLDDGKRSP